MISFIKNKYYLAFLALVFVFTASLIPTKGVDGEMRVAKALALLGQEEIGAFPDTREFGVSADRGKDIVIQGFSTKPGGGETGRQSKHFVCTSCHNIEREDPDLRFADPQARLEYTAQKGLPFLQATTLYGVVNRRYYYNGDYEKKYGSLVHEARDNIRAAIQLCAIECSQGRKLKKWELESILAYLWTIDLKLKDLNLTEKQIEFIDESLFDSSLQDSAVNLIQARYLKASPAHFGTAYDSHIATDTMTGNPENGKLIYENSCLYCHENKRYSFFHLDNSELSFDHLAEKAGGYGRHSIYQRVRFGMSPKAGKRSYMPQYTMEKMSDQQLKDLESYICSQAD